MPEEIYLEAKRKFDEDNSNPGSRIILKDKEDENPAQSFRERYFQSTISNLIIFILFLTTLSFITFGTASTARYHLTRAVSMTFFETAFDRGIQFQSISSVKDIWLFLEEVALPNLFAMDIIVVNKTTNVTSNYVLDGNIMLGLPRLKQLRVRNDSCTVHEDFRALVKACYNSYSEKALDKRPFGLRNGTAWVYFTEQELGATSYWGLLHSYSGGGSYEDLGLKSSNPYLQLLILQNNNWINLATRIVVLDFTLYNVNVNLFSVVKIVLELPAAGGVWTSNTIRTVNLLRYVTTWDYFILALEILFCLFTLYYFLVLAIEISAQGIKFFLLKWNLLDSFILIISIICIAFGIYRTVLMKKLLKNLLFNPAVFANFDNLSYWHTLFDIFTAILVFLTWIKIFKYLSFNETMIQLSTTLSQCAKDVGGFAVMFFIMFLAYAQLGYLLFGSQLPNFSRLETSIFTLMRLILGDFDYISLERANRIMGPIYFVTFVFFVFVILLNMFLAILSDTYTSVKAKMEKEISPGQFDFAKFFKTISNKFVNLFKKNDQTVDDNLEESLETKKSKENEKIKDKKEKNDSQNTGNLDLGNNVKLLKSVPLEDFEKLRIRVDDLRHEMDQIQKALISKMSTIGRNFERLAESFPKV